MSNAVWGAARNDGLTRSKIRIGRGLSESAVADVVRALQRVPGVLTVSTDADHNQAFVAHDAGVSISALVGAANRAGAIAHADIVPPVAVRTVETGSAPPRTHRRLYMAAIGIGALIAVIFIDFVLPASADKRWPFIAPIIVLWAFLLLQATRTRRS